MDSIRINKNIRVPSGHLRYGKKKSYSWKYFCFFFLTGINIQYGKEEEEEEGILFGPSPRDLLYFSDHGDL